MTRPHAAPRHVLRLDARWIGLFLCLASAVLTLALLLAIVGWFFSLLPYVPSAP